VITVTGTGVPVTVLHRLALGVEAIDAATAARAQYPLVAERELPADLWEQRPGRMRTWPTAPPRVGPRLIDGLGGRFRLLHDGPIGSQVTVRLFDHDRRCVPRRLQVPPWTMAEVGASEQDPPGPYVRVLSRVLRPWLSPGMAYPVSGVTAIRARLVLGTAPLRWARVTAVETQSQMVVGRAHGDERGEFLLLISGRGTIPPPRDSIDVTLRIRARVPQPEPDPRDPLADLPIEVFPRSANPPTAADLDNPRLRGQQPPPGYRLSSGRPQLRIPIGSLYAPGVPYPFIP
jgi:hypothetical protein